MKTALNCLLLFALLVGACSPAADRDKQVTQQKTVTYTCPMHPEIIREQPGDCPICGMTLVPTSTPEQTADPIGPETLLQPANGTIRSSAPTVSLQHATRTITIDAVGTATYNTRLSGSIAAPVSGRIEKLYLKYNFQDVTRSQKVLELYSPDWLTAQDNLLFILRNDPENTSLVEAARQKLLLLGFPSALLEQVVRTRQSVWTVPLLSRYSGHIHDMSGMDDVPATAFTTPGLMIKEGMYVAKGQTLFNVLSPDNMWVLLNIYPGQQALIKKGQAVELSSNDLPDLSLRGTVDDIEPFFRPGSKTMTVRVVLQGKHGDHVPVGTTFRGSISGAKVTGNWLPREAVLSLGFQHVVLLREAGGFRVRAVQTGAETAEGWQITGGLSADDRVAANAQFLIDSESFIPITPHP